MTSKIPKDAITLSAGKPKEHAADNGSGVVIHREFCDNCGSFILEYGVLKPDLMYLLGIQADTFMSRMLPEKSSGMSV